MSELAGQRGDDPEQPLDKEENGQQQGVKQHRLSGVVEDDDADRQVQDAGQEAEEKAAPAARAERPKDVKHPGAQQEKAEEERRRHGGQDRVGHGHRAQNDQGDAKEHKPEPVFP